MKSIKNFSWGNEQKISNIFQQLAVKVQNQAKKPLLYSQKSANKSGVISISFLTGRSRMFIQSRTMPVHVRRPITVASTPAAQVAPTGGNAIDTIVGRLSRAVPAGRP